MKLAYDPVADRINSKQFQLNLPVRGPGKPRVAESQIGVVHSLNALTNEDYSAILLEIPLDHLDTEDRIFTPSFKGKY